MKPIKLYIENFGSHEKSFIDFTQFNSALIVGKVEGNDLRSNGVGKTTIFKAIEYVLFNEADCSLEELIRDETDLCKITYDFLIHNQEYRVVRKRSRKGSTDLSLYERNSVLGDPDEDTNLEFWKDLTGRRASDTEKELEKLIKINYKAFRSTIHFIQNDFSGLTTATPGDRKKILKEALNIAVYSKLEKLAKDKASVLSKEIDKIKTLIGSFNNLDQELVNFNSKLTDLSKILDLKKVNLTKFQTNIEISNFNIQALKNSNSNLETKLLSLINKESLICKEIDKLENWKNLQSSKKSEALKAAKQLVEELKALEVSKDELSKLDFNNNIESKISSLKEKLSYLNVSNQNTNIILEELNIPIQDHDVCKHCRQSMSQEHIKECRLKIKSDIEKYRLLILDNKKQITVINSEIFLLQKQLDDLNKSKRNLQLCTDNITTKNKELKDKKELYEEYIRLFNKFVKELEEKNTELQTVKVEIQESSTENFNITKQKIKDDELAHSNLIREYNSLTSEFNGLNENKAVIIDNIKHINENIINRKSLISKLENLELTYKNYPIILQAFSSTGIPNLIIQNVLDDLQAEANRLLLDLKPGLQLSFFVEKVNDKKVQSDTLDINYSLQGKKRHFSQLSGAEKISVTFALKLGLSFLLQKMIGTDIKLLMLDEIDQSLDKASVDAFADIVKFFQNEFKILVITHNDRLKDKISHAILVEQDINMTSRAKVVSTW